MNESYYIIQVLYEFSIIHINFKEIRVGGLKMALVCQLKQKFVKFVKAGHGYDLEAPNS